MTALSQINDVDSFITFDANFGDVHYMSSSYINPVTRRHDYVPEIVSSSRFQVLQVSKVMTSV